MSAAIAIVVVGLLQVGELPAALQRLIDRDQTIETAHIEWSRQSAAHGNHEIFQSTRLGVDSGITTRLGDHSGVQSWDENGRPEEGPHHPGRYAFTSDGMYTRFGNGVSASLDPDGRAWDPTGFGLAPFSRPRNRQDAREHPIAAALAGLAQNGQVEFAAHEVNGFQEITARAGNREIRWKLDPERDLLPVECSLVIDGHPVFAARTRLARFGDNWFPAEVRQYRGNTGEDAGPTEILRVSYAALNQPGAQRHFTPADIGIEVGFNLQVGDPRTGQPTPGKWDGGKVVSLAEYNTRYRAGELRSGPAMARAMATSRALQEEILAGRVDAPEEAERLRAERKEWAATAWEMYTQRVIRKYAFDDAQTQKALGICKEAQSLADRYRATVAAQIEELEQDERKGENAETRQRRERLMEPVQRIFDTALKPRLEALPTRQQRADAEANQAPADPATGG